MLRGKKRARNPRRAAPPQTQTKQVFSYYNAANNQTRADKPKRPKVTRNRNVSKHLKHIPSYIAAVAILVSLAFILSVNPDPRLELLQANTSASLLRSQTEYQVEAKKILGGSIFNRSKITINTKGFAVEMKQKFPELSDVSVTLPLMGRRPVVQLVSARPVLILRGQDGSFVLDKDGRAILPQSQLHNGEVWQLPTVEDQSTVKIELGKSALPGKEVAFIEEVVGQLNAKQIKIREIVLPRAAEALDVRIEGQPYYIKFSLQTDAKTAVGAFLAVKQKLDNDHTVPSQYIDVRVEGKAYYK